MTYFAINDSDWSGQHSVLGTTRMHASAQTLPPTAKGLVPRLTQCLVFAYSLHTDVSEIRVHKWCLSQISTHYRSLGWTWPRGCVVGHSDSLS